MRSLLVLVPTLLIACHQNEPPRAPEPAAGTVAADDVPPQRRGQGQRERHGGEYIQRDPVAGAQPFGQRRARSPLRC